MGCFNMSCAVTNTPITYGDDIIVGIACEAEQMSSKVLPVYFEGKYNDYGTVEEYDPESFTVQWFKKIISDPSETDDDFEENIRNGTDRFTSEVSRQLTSMFDFTVHHRIVFIHKSVWDKIVHYKKNACCSYYYFNPNSRYEINYRDEITTTFNDVIEERESDPNRTDEQNAIARLKRLMSRSRPLKDIIADKVLDFVDAHDFDRDQVIKCFVKWYEESSKVTQFANAINCSLYTRYASQDTCDEEQAIFAALLNERLEVLRLRYDE